MIDYYQIGAFESYLYFFQTCGFMLLSIFSGFILLFRLLLFIRFMVFEDDL